MAPLESRPSLTRTRNITTHYSPLTTYYSLAHHSLLTAHCSPVNPSTRDKIINTSNTFVGTRSSPGPVPEYSISPQGCENLSLEWLGHASMAEYNRLCHRLVAEGNRVKPVEVAGAVADTPAAVPPSKVEANVGAIGKTYSALSQLHSNHTLRDAAWDIFHGIFVGAGTSADNYATLEGNQYHIGDRKTVHGMSWKDLYAQVISRPIPSHPISSNLIPSHPIPSHPIPSHPIPFDP